MDNADTFDTFDIFDIFDDLSTFDTLDAAATLADLAALATPVRRIVRNQAKCLECGETIVSRSRHDFVTCDCGALSVDGGLSYVRRAFRSPANFEELSLYSDAPLADGSHQLENSEIVLIRVHPSAACHAERCTIHAMSDHRLRAYEQVWSGGRMWRRCDHDVLHPDPDEYGLGATLPLEHECCAATCCADAYDDDYYTHDDGVVDHGGSTADSSALPD